MTCYILILCNDDIKCAYGMDEICPTALFGTIHESQCTILVNFYLYLQYFQQNVFSFNKINGFQTDPKNKHYLILN